MLLIVQVALVLRRAVAKFSRIYSGGKPGVGSRVDAPEPSAGLWLSAGVLPFCTFYAITSFLLGQTLGVCLFICAAYGFTAIAMLVPAVSEFDVVLGGPRSIRGSQENRETASVTSFAVSR